VSSFPHRSIDFLATVLFLQFVMGITVILNIPVARPIIGFVYFTFVPGFIIIKLLKMTKLNFLETVLLSAGFSIAFVMLFGLFINSFLPLLNIARPLSVVPLTVLFSAAVVIGAFAAFLRNADTRIFNFKISTPYLLLIILLISIPILSIVGAIFANVYNNNLILLIMILLIALVFAFFAIFRELSFSQLYPFILFIIAISLLFHFSLISNYVHGPDSSAEYFVMSNTQTNAIWNPLGPYLNNAYWGRLNSMLSLTILPTIYSTVLNIDLTSTYQIIFPLLFSLVPLVLYQIWQTYIGKKYAFVAGFLLIAEPTFYTEMLSLTRQMIGELFFVLLFFVLLKKDMKKLDRMLCFALFSFGLVVSHYALAEIFLYFIGLTYVVILVFDRFSKRRINTNISITMILLFGVIMFFWYIFTSGSAVFSSFLTFGQSVINQLSDFANPASRGSTVLLGLGLTAPPTIWNSISRIFAYLTEGLIVIGFIWLFVKRVRTNYDSTYTILTSLSIVLLAALLLVPGLASTLNMSRFYHILLFFLAPLCVLGAVAISRVISKFVYPFKKEILASLLLAIVLTAYFLFQTGFVYELTGSPSDSLPLNVDRLGPNLALNYAVVNEQDVVGAQWFSQYAGGGSSQVWAGDQTPLIGYGAINDNRLSALSNVTEPNEGDFVYLGTLNTRYGVVVGENVWNTSSILEPFLPFSNNIYSSNDCQISKFISTP